MGSAVGTEPWIFLILWKYGVISCQSGAGYWHKHYASLFSRIMGNFSTRVKQYTYVCLKWLSVEFF